MRGILWTLLHLAGFCVPGSTQTGFIPVSYTIAGTSYTQNFDGLPASGSFSLTGKGPISLSVNPVNAVNISGWQLLMTAGSNSNAAFATGTGSSTGNGVYSLGSSGSADRALGSLSSSTGIYAFGLILTNQTGSVLNSFSVSFTAEQWRKGGSSNKNTWTFRYKTGLISQITDSGLVAEPNLNFNSVTTGSAGSVNGNISTNQQNISFTVSAIHWKQGEQLLLRWDDADEPGSDDVVAMDNFVFSANLVSGPPLVSNVQVDSVTGSTALVTAYADDHYQASSIRAYYDTSAAFLSPIIVRPAPDTLAAGSGNTFVAARLTGLVSGKQYHCFFTVTNAYGKDSSSILSFRTTVNLPAVITTLPAEITTQTATVGGVVTSEGGAAVTERGIVWQKNVVPSLNDSVIRSGAGTGSFATAIYSLPPATVIYARAYAINSGGIAYGNSERFVTPTTITSLAPVTPGKTNADTVMFRLQTAQNITGLRASNFALPSNKPTGAAIAAVTGSDTVFTITVSTGSGDGLINIRLVNDSGLSVPVYNKPFAANGYYQVDKTGPVIRQISIPDTVMKIGDTIPVHILIAPENEPLNLSAGTIADYTITGFNKKNDSLYTAYGIISGNEKNIAEEDNIPVSISLLDETGNTSVYRNNIHQDHDRIDASRPSIISVRYPPKGIYKTGDTLDFYMRFSEKVRVNNGVPSLTLTIGTRSRAAVYTSGSGSDSLLFRYIIQPGEIDSDGIKTSSVITITNALLTDAAGNKTSVGLGNTLPAKTILVDAVLPVITQVTTPPPAVYKSGDSLVFRISFSKKVWAIPNKMPPVLSLTIGNKSRNAVFYHGSGTDTLLFRYLIQRGDTDTNGIKLVSPLIDSNFSIYDSLGNPANLVLHNIGNTEHLRINPPVLVATDLQLPESRTYTTNDTLVFGIHYSENVFVSAPETHPYLTITIGKSKRKAYYSKGSGTQRLFFIYQIQPDELDKKGITISESISLNNAVITDENDYPAPLSLPGAIQNTHIRVDAIAPAFTSVTDTIRICQNSQPLSLSEWLNITDEESGELISGEIKSGAKTAAVYGSHFSILSNGKSIRPAAIRYQVLPTVTGTDTLTVSITDGSNRSEKKILIQITPVIGNNRISGPGIICASQPSPLLRGSVPEGGDGDFKFTWESATTADSSRFITAEGYYQENDYSPASITTHWFRRKVVSGGCTDLSASLKMISVKKGLWLGTENRNWNQAGNWCGTMVPNAETDVYLAAEPIHPPLISDTASCHQLLIDEKNMLTIEGILRVYGEINAVSNRINAEQGSLVLQGSTQQNILGSVFTKQTIRQLLINNSQNVQIKDPLFISGELRLQAGSLYTNDYLRMKEYARLGSSTDGTTLAGKLTATQLIKGGRRVFRLLGHPFTHPIGLSMLKDSIDITGNNGNQNGFANSQTQAPSAFYFDPDKGNDSAGMEAGWQPFTHTNGQGENAWNPGVGIRLLVRGKPGQGLDGTIAGDGKNGTYLPLPVQLSYTGQVTTGDQETTLNTIQHSGYHMIGNPYLSNIDLSRTSRTSGISRHYWLWHPMQGKQGGYSCYPFSSKNILASFGAFFVETTGMGQHQFVFSENSKSADTATEHRVSVIVNDWYHIELRLETDSIFWDQLLLLQMDSARWGYDRNDAAKFRNSDVNFYSLTPAGKMLSIDARPFSNESTIPIGLQTTTPEVFKIRVASVNLPPSNTLMLHDRYLEKWMPLNKDSIYQFVTNLDSVTQGNNRFEITSRKAVDTAPPPTAIEIRISPVPARDQLRVLFRAAEKGKTSIRILGLSGTLIKTISLGIQKEAQVLIPVGELLSGVYLLELRCGNQISNSKFIKD